MTEQTDTDRRATATDARLHRSELPGEVSSTAAFDPRSVVAIERLDDFVVRNLWIAQRYHELAGRLTPFLGRDHGWCTFAVWRSAGLRRRLRRTEIADDQAGDAAAALVDALAIHETDVFGFLAPLFDGFIRQFESGTAQSIERQRVLGDIGVLDAEPAVRIAFSQYFAAVHDTDAIRRSQRVLAANLLLTLHEQDQFQIELDRITEQLSRQAEHLAMEDTARWMPAPLGRRLVRGHRLSIDAALRRVVSRELAEAIAVVPVDSTRLDLTVADDFVWPSALDVASISVLAEVLDTWADDESADMFERDVRLRVLERFYRSGQHDDRLAVAPFGRRQLESMRRLQVPNLD